MSTCHITIDCETLAVDTRPIIASIGAARFYDSPEHSNARPTFEVLVNVEEQRGYRTFDPNTAVWWLTQEPPAIKATFCREPRFILPEALQQLSTWIYGQRGFWSSVDLRIWTNGAAADAVWLETAYKDCRLPCPWTFRDVRCLRTLYALFPGAKPAGVGLIVHNAVDDAIYQAQRAEMCFARLKAKEYA